MVVLWIMCVLTIDDNYCSRALVQHFHHFRVTRDSSTRWEGLVHLNKLLTMQHLVSVRGGARSV